MISSKKFLLVIEKALRLSADTGQKVLSYGDFNLYPQIISELIYGSKTASACVIKMAENIVCEGFENEGFASETNELGYDNSDLLDLIANDVARFMGFALIVQYKGYGALRTRKVYHVPFEYVRARLNPNYIDDQRAHEWVVFNNWEKEAAKSTNSATAGKVYKTFNPDAFDDECEAVGGIENHAGQLFYCDFGTTRPYPLSCFHAVRNEMSAEAKNSLYVNRTLGRGFHMCSIVSHGEFESDAEQDSFRDAVAGMMGSDNAGAVLCVRDQNINDKPFIKVENVGTPVDANLYKAYCEPLRKDIAIAAYNIPIPLIDSSLVNFANSSGELVKEMQKVYRKSLAKIRKRISRDLAYVLGLDENITQIKNELTDELPNINITEQV